MIAAFRSLGPGRILALFVGLAVVAGVTTYMVDEVQRPGMALLYGGLSPQEASQIDEFLATQGVAYEVRQDGSVYVAGDQVGQMRLAVAGQGLVGGGAGYELFDNQSAFGSSNFVSNLNARRALEGELARTIGTLPAVQGARVHLVMPKQNLFSRETVEPSAAVALNVGARRLDEDQVRSIASLVAAAVPNLLERNVTVIDQRGTLLFDGRTQGSGMTAMADLRRAVEQDYISSLTTMLERVVGMGKVAVRVAAEVNTDRVTEQAEIYDPTQQVVRSEQVIETASVSSNGAPGGLAGIAGNIPGEEAGAAGGGSNSNDTRTETTTNFEIGRTVRNLERVGGEVQRLSVAVLVEGRTEAPATEGGAPSYVPLSETERNSLRTLVQTAIGFDAARGDRVEVIDMPFTPQEEVVTEAAPFMTQDQVLMLARYVLIALALAAVGLLVVKPALTTLNTALAAAAPVVVQNAPIGGGGGGGAELPLGEQPGGEGMINLSSVQGRVRESAVKKVAEIVDQYPEESLNVVRNWMNAPTDGARNEG